MQLFTFWLFFWCSLGQATPHQSIYGFDEIVVVIEENIITKSDVTKEIALTAALPIHSTILQRIREKNALEGLILLELIAQMAGDTSLYKAKDADIIERLELFKSQWSSPVEYQFFLNSIHINEEQVKRIIERHLVAEQYVYRNLGVKNNTNSIKEEEDFQNWVLLNKEKISIRYLN
tara:strand:+ start:149 stop:679 length:531 start_codon:yes stop_codon:yes gene_type:complete